MEKDTFSDPEVVAEMKKLVPIRINAEGGGEELARRFGVDSYPTIVFVGPDGDEVDRILGYLPPGEFLRQTRRIRTGDTFMACLYRLAENPADAEALSRAVSGLLERSDPEGAIARVKAFHHATEKHHHDACMGLMFQARAALQSRLYERAGKLYRTGWSAGFVVPDTEGTRGLRTLIDKGLSEMPPDEQAERLRAARFEDAAQLLDMIDLGQVDPVHLIDVANFAFENGQYDSAASIYALWYDAMGERAEPDDLNTAAWQLYLTSRSLDLGLTMAHQAYRLDPSTDIADTLARLLYVTGDRNRAIELERYAAQGANEVDEAFFSEGLTRMEAGQDLGDRPAFDSYPGERIDSLAGPTRSVI
jgi:thioredoxin-like negative regulator of GroEL